MEQLISEPYRKLNIKLHKSPRGFGASGHRWTQQISRAAERNHIRSLLDYGCGQSTFWAAFKKDYPKLAAKIDYYEYDPAVAGKQELPNDTYDMVTCTDVLEHVEPDLLRSVIKHIFSLAKFVVFFNIAICPANKQLPDGRNAHLIVKSDNWWINQISAQTIGWKLTSVESNRWKDVNIWATARERTSIRY